MFRVFNSTSNTISLLPLDWISRLEGCIELKVGCENWWAGYPFILWLELRKSEENDKGSVVLFAEVGPITDHASRCRLIDSIDKVARSKALNNLGFQKGAKDEGKKYSRFFKDNKIPVHDYYDHDLIASAMEKALIKFKEEIVSVGEGISLYKENL